MTKKPKKKIIKGWIAKDENGEISTDMDRIVVRLKNELPESAVIKVEIHVKE